MNKPTTEIRVQDLKYGPNLTAGELADHLDFNAQIGRAHRAANNGWGSGHEDTWEKAAAKLRELERENAEMRAALEMCIPWTEVAIDKMDSTPLAMGRLEKVRGFKKLLKEDS